MIFNEFRISGNLDNNEIDKFIDLYRNKGLNSNPIRIIFDEQNDSSQKVGEVDALFLCYLMLFIEEDNREFRFVFSESISESRIYSLRDQLEHLVFTLKEVLFKIPNIKLYRFRVNQDTGEIQDETNKNFLRYNELDQSEKFIPLIFINENADIYFKRFVKQSPLNKIYSLYYNKIIFEIENKTKLEKIIIEKEFQLSDLSFIEICIFRLLLNDNLFEKLANEQGGKITDEEKRFRLEKNINKIHYFRKYCEQLCNGLKELALNINHSSTKKGVISARIFDRSRLKILKDIDAQYIDNYIDNNYFLDVNVVDLGLMSIRQKYIENIEQNKKDYSEISQLKINFNKDILIISDNSTYKFQDFFIPNTKTEHQVNKLISRYGLQYLSHIISRRFSGYIQSISHSEKLVFFEEKEKLSIKDDYENSFRLGTSYNCIIPLDKFQEYYNKTENVILKSELKTALPAESTLSTLDKFNIVKLDKLAENVSEQPIISINFPFLSNESKYDYIFHIYNKFYQIDKKYWNQIYLINANEFKIADSSSWLRLLSAISIDFKNIIIYNIPKEITKEVIDIRRSQSCIDMFNFWEDESFILFYSEQKKIDEKYGRFGATILSGKTEKKYNYVNLVIWKHHYSFYNGFILKSGDKIEIEEYPLKSKLFNNGNLNYFELIINNVDKYDAEISLFELSLQYALNKNLIDNLDTNTNNKGYKISNTHFRLGSKIHIKDFYYAKRLFHTSFFTTPLSYILANYISKYLLKEPTIKDITLIGYEYYSDFLVSTTRGLLSNRFKGYNISHATFINGKELNRPLKNINSNIFLIVPIASSFSTSIKIKNEIFAILRRYDETKEFNFIEPHINLILVGDKEFEKKINTKKTTDSFNKFNDDILKEYGWESINLKEKEIKIQTFSKSDSEDKNSNIVIQRYFIPVYTKWYKSNTCDLCFPISINREKCLVETGFASITPRLIFSMPKVKKNHNPGNVLNLSGSLLYGNLKHGTNTYLYYTRVGDIINKKLTINNIEKEINKERIIKWLKHLRTDLFEKQEVKSKKIVLITPSNGAKSNFLDLVNEVVFDYTANCLTISLYDEYIENAESLYADGLYKADIVIYVDDVLSTMKSFNEINNIIKYIRNKIRTGNGIDYCISLINRMSYDCQENLLLKLIPLNNSESYSIIDHGKESMVNGNETEVSDIEIRLKDAEKRLIYYCKINNPSIEEPDNSFPLDKESLRYENLMRTSSLDSIRNLFYRKSERLKTIDLSFKMDEKTKNRIDDSKVFQNKKLFQLLVQNIIYNLFEYDSIKKKYKYQNILDDLFSAIIQENKLESFKKLIKKIEELLYNESDLNFKEHAIILNKYRHNIEYVVLKIICSTPLIYYKNIRESAFEWVIALLEELRTGKDSSGIIIKDIIGIDNITNSNLSTYFEVNSKNYYSELQKLKFLLKRTVQLKSNYIIHPQFLDSIKRLINEIHKSYYDCYKSKIESDNYFLEKVKKLLEINYPSGKKEVLFYINELVSSKLFSSDFFDEVLIIYTEEKVNLEIQNFILKNSNRKITRKINEDKIKFEKGFEDLKSHKKYRLTTSKKLIYELIALIQELIYEHETKAVKLEEIINSIVIEQTEETNNGDFNHYLRLLKLENTAAINLFWEYFRDKEISLSNFKEIDVYKALEKYKLDPKYTSISLLVNEQIDNDLFISYIKLNTIFYQWNNHIKDESTSLLSQIKIILELCSKIVGDGTECYLSVNYKGSLNPKSNEIFVFERYPEKDSDFRLDVNSNMENSITLKMFEGINETVHKYLALSNFEVYKSKEDLYPKYRKEILFGSDDKFEPRNAYECTFENIKEEYNLLFLRISDFVDNPISSVEYDKILNTQAVLTFYIKKGKRVNEKRLRLLLLLRKQLSDFIKNHLTESHLQEYINLNEQDKYRDTLSHRISTYLRKQMDAYSSNKMEEVQIINNAITGQTNAYDINKNDPDYYVSSTELEHRLNILLESSHLPSRNYIKSEYHLDIPKNLNIHFDSFVYDIIIPEIIFNIRRHGPTKLGEVAIRYYEDKLTIKSKQEAIIDYKKGKGTAMCENLCKKLGRTIEYTPNVDIEGNYYFMVTINQLNNRPL